MSVSLWLALAFNSEAIAAPGGACLPCHAAIVESFRNTGMGRSINVRPAPAPAAFYHRRSNRHYTVSEKSMRRHQVDSSGKEVNILEKPITLAIGSGNHAVTYISRSAQGRLIELPLSWYKEPGGYAMSPGYDSADHADFRREISDSCLFCHSAGPEPAPIDCHRCHGSVAAHVKSPSKTNILNPGRLEPQRQLEICLQCHLETASRGIVDSLRLPGRDAWSLRPGEPLSDYKIYFDRLDSDASDRFEINHAGYRLLKSACYRKSEGRMVCTTCHDPHTARVRSDSCAQCHTAAHAADASLKNGACASCHMPKRVPSDAIHTVMTDHKIMRRPKFTNPTEEDHKPYAGAVQVHYGHADELLLALANIRDASAETLAVYRRQLARAPDDVSLLAALGKALLRLNRAREAVPLFEKALRVDSMHTDSRNHLGVALALLGRYRDSLEQLRRAVADNPDHALSWANLGATLEALGEKEEAWSAYNESIRLQPDSAEARRRRAALRQTN